MRVRWLLLRRLFPLVLVIFGLGTSINFLVLCVLNLCLLSRRCISQIELYSVDSVNLMAEFWALIAFLSINFVVNVCWSRRCVVLCMCVLYVFGLRVCEWACLLYWVCVHACV